MNFKEQDILYSVIWPDEDYPPEGSYPYYVEGPAGFVGKNNKLAGLIGFTGINVVLDGNIVMVGYSKNGTLHNDKGFVYLSFYDGDTITPETSGFLGHHHYLNGHRILQNRREDLPGIDLNQVKPGDVIKQFGFYNLILSIETLSRGEIKVDMLSKNDRKVRIFESLSLLRLPLLKDNKDFINAEEPFLYEKINKFIEFSKQFSS